MGHASAKKAAPKGRGVYAQDPPAATFDLIGSTTEELQVTSHLDAVCKPAVMVAQTPLPMDPAWEQGRV